MSTLRVDNLQTTDGNETVEVSEILTSENFKSSDIAAPGSILKFGDVSGLPAINIPDEPDQRLIVQKTASNINDFSTMQINRTCNVKERTADGYVGTTLRVYDTVNKGANAQFEWSLLSVMDNYADVDKTQTYTSPQNVAIYGQSNQYGTSATWAQCLEITDHNSPAAEASIGMEITLRAAGADPTYQRNGIHLSLNRRTESSEACEWGRGILVTSESNCSYNYVLQNQSAAKYVISNTGDSTSITADGALIRDRGKSTYGIDLAGATYTSHAIRLAVNQAIAFDATGSNTIKGTTAGIVVTGTLNVNNRLSVPASGNTSSSATAGGVQALPATVSGYYIISIDGTNYKIPYYQA